MNSLNLAGQPYSASSLSSSTTNSPVLKGSSLTSLFLAAVLPFFLLKVCSFFNRTWPNFVYRLLTSRLERQLATVTERVRPNRIIQDDIMVRIIMGYVSYCYMQTLRQGANACDAVGMADYDYSFIYEHMEDFDESWVPYSAHYKTLFGRVIASAMELSVIPSLGQAIQVEPGLFVRLLENKHVHSHGGEESNGLESDEDEKGSNCAQGSGGCNDSKRRNQMDKLNQYMFYDMRKFAENMDEHAQPRIDGNADDISSVERPFDPPLQQRRGGRGDKEGEHGAKADTTIFGNDSNPPQENFIVLEYRRPLPYEKSQALCSGRTTAGAAVAYDETCTAGDVIEGFLSRAHRWYLGHMAQRKTSPLIAIYPSPGLVMFGKRGVSGLNRRSSNEGDFTGRCYVLESASLAMDAEAAKLPTPSSPSTGASPGPQAAAAAAGSGENQGEGAIAAAAVTIGPHTVVGGHIGLHTGGYAAASTGKTFRSLFFPSKARVLSLIDDFVNERGCYGVPGVAARLNVLLHGAPGTGKTSFVKALARHLRRNLVVLSMSEILTVDELQKLLQPFELQHSGKTNHKSYFSVRPHQSIYVFEDFDAIGDAWKALKHTQGELKVMKEQKMAELAAEKAAKKAETKTDLDDDESVEEGEETQQRRKSAAVAESSTDGDYETETSTEGIEAESDAWHGSSSFDEEGGDSDTYDDDDEETQSSHRTWAGDKFLIKDTQMTELERSHLTVEKFLDLFNSFNLPDSFIAVFTTNHPEKVHPSIISSHMMDVTLDMGMLTEACAVEMVEHYFVDELAAETADPTGRRHLTPTQAAEIRAALAEFNKASDGLSGALLEKMCVECETVEQLTRRLRAADSWDAINTF
jgi:hypothetical protein